jgi:hypothetical protein
MSEVALLRLRTWSSGPSGFELGAEEEAAELGRREEAEDGRDDEAELGFGRSVVSETEAPHTFAKHG